MATAWKQTFPTSPKSQEWKLTKALKFIHR